MSIYGNTFFSLVSHYNWDTNVFAYEKNNKSSDECHLPA